MPYCPRCGVEVEANKMKCPLCNTPLQPLDEEQPDYKSKYPDDVPKDEQKPPKEKKKKKKRLLIFEITSVILVIPLIVSITTNLIIDGTVTWSLYPIASLLLAWFMISAPLLFPNNVVAIAAGEFIPLLVYFLVIDLLDNGQLNWYVRIALPIIVSVGAASFIIAFGSLKSKNKGLNIPAYFLFGASIICLIVDVCVTSYINSALGLKWSLYVLVPAMLTGGFLLYLHFRVTKNKDLKRRLQP